MYHAAALAVSPVLTVLPEPDAFADEFPEPDASWPASPLSSVPVPFPVPSVSSVPFPAALLLFSVLPLLSLFSTVTSPLTASCNDVTALAISVVVLSAFSVTAFAAVIVSSRVFKEASV